jgi:hypothetical protein
MAEDTALVGFVLLGVVPFVVWDAVSTLRAGFDNAFWAQPLEAKMGRIAEQRDAWQRLGVAWIYIGVLLAAGFAAFSTQLSGAGESAWAAIGFGSFMLTAAAFVTSVALMVATIASASDAMVDGDAVPAWAMPAWTATWWLERTFVIGANVAYVAWGIGIVASGFPATWVGWVAIITGGAIAIWASLREYFFQHMVLITPVVLGVALVIY